MAKKKLTKRNTATTSAKKSRKGSGATDGLAILDRKFFNSKAKQELLEQARADDEVGRKIYELRTRAGLTQRELAKMVGTTASVICKLEDADYGGHSMPMLRRIATALNKRVEIRFVSLPRSAQTA
ncbi:helix-turn-helix transcriptional regulator [Pirellulales bacterium]|nr:helix-turn-helix transcriptional regulator [Pirellulales bacterium]